MKLPSYAHPIFLRFTNDEIAKTGTFKFSKVVYKKQGYDPSKIVGDKVYFRDHEKNFYTEVNDEVYKTIVSQQIKI